jgi:hypothetical protein
MDEELPEFDAEFEFDTEPEPESEEEPEFDADAEFEAEAEADPEDGEELSLNNEGDGLMDYRCEKIENGSGPKRRTGKRPDLADTMTPSHQNLGGCPENSHIYFAISLSDRRLPTHNRKTYTAVHHDL